MSATESSPQPKSRYAALSAAIRHASTADAAALARMDVEAPLQPHQIGAGIRAFLAAGLEPDHWQAQTWAAWIGIAHGIALAGHDGGQPFGKQMAVAGVAESRVTKLLTARGDAFSALIPRLLRLLASKGVAPNWNELGALIHAQASGNAEEAERLRLRIASRYFSEINQRDRQAAG
jgi:CRISPR system Cascade subunit CasB